MPDITLQHPPVCTTVSPVILDHVILQAHQAVMCSFLLLAGEVVSDEALADGVVQDVIHDSMENHLVHERRSLHQPFLRLIDLEYFKLAGSIDLLAQDGRQLRCTDQSVRFILSGGNLVPFSFSRCQVRFVERLEGTHLFIGQSAPPFNVGWPGW